MRFVLVRPRDPNNIGAAARVMANFGFDDLVAVDPWDPTWREAKAAVGATQVLASARSVATLDEAIGDSTYVVATTAATGRRLAASLDPRAVFSMMLEQGIEPARISLLFGNEKHGLTTDELDRAHAVVTIPTSVQQPSMNLAQAIAVMCWEAARAYATVHDALEPALRSEERPATVQEIEHLIAVAIGSTSRPDDVPRPDAAADRLRRILLRSNASSNDIQLLFALLNCPSDNDSTV